MNYLLPSKQNGGKKSKNKYSKKKGGNCQSSGCVNNQRLFYSTEGKLQCNNAANKGGQVMNYLLPSKQNGGAREYTLKINMLSFTYKPDKKTSFFLDYSFDPSFTLSLDEAQKKAKKMIEGYTEQFSEKLMDQISVVKSVEIRDNETLIEKIINPKFKKEEIEIDNNDTLKEILSKIFVEKK